MNDEQSEDREEARTAAEGMGWRRGLEKAKTISVVLYPEEVEWMRRRADGLRMSLSQMVRVMVRRQMQIDAARRRSVER